MFRRLRPAVMTMLGTSLALAVQAQTAAPGPAAASAEARAQQQADKVFTWIRLHAEKPQAKRNTPAAEPAPNSNASAQAKAVAKPVSKPTPMPASASSTASTTAATPADAAAAAIAAVLPAGRAGNSAGSAALSSGPRQAPPQDIEAAAADPSAATNEKTLLAAASLAVPKPGLQAPVAPVAPEPEPEPAPLKLLHKVDPEVPRQLQRDFRGGTVLLRFTVMADGSVEQAEAVNASNKRLASAAVAALSQWRFAPIEAPRVASVEIGFQVE